MFDDVDVTGIYRGSAAAHGPVQLGQGNAVVAKRLGLGVLRLRQRQLGVGKLENRPHPGVEPALGQAEVLLSGGDEDLGSLDTLLSLLDGDLGLLDVLDDVELRGLHPLLRGLEVGLCLLVPRDPEAPVEERPRESQPERPVLVELGLVAPELAAAVRAAAADVGEEVAEGLALGGLGGADRELGLTVFGSLTHGLAAKLATVEVHGLEDEVVLDLGG